MIRTLSLILALAWSGASLAEEVVAGLSQARVDISANFDGSEISIFGAVKREAPIDYASDLGVIITIEGPNSPVMVRRKERRALLWVNAASVEVDSAPSFYAVNTSGPLVRVLRDTEDLRHDITVNRAIRSVGAPMDIANPQDFTRALIRIRSAENLYQTNISAVRVREQTLFNTSVALPANLTEGLYVVRIFLTRDGAVVTEETDAILVEKVGLERFLYTLAHDRPLIYGLMSLAIAIAAGWTASAVFRYLRG